MEIVWRVTVDALRLEMRKILDIKTSVSNIRPRYYRSPNNVVSVPFSESKV